MKCPRCQFDTRVRDSRPTDQNTVKRRRVCDGCGFKFHTFETTVNPDQALRRRQKFNEYMRAWKARNPEKVKALNHRRKRRQEARKEAAALGVPVETIYAQWGVA
jgi:transcriptional regulator NrdR family protein